VGTLRIVKVHDTIEILILAVRNVVVVRRDLRPKITQRKCDLLNNLTSLIHLIEDTFSAADILAMARRYDDFHGKAPKINMSAATITITEARNSAPRAWFDISATL
jgi:hypothetical protein